MRKAIKIIAALFGIFFLAVVLILVMDISNDVEFTVIEKKESSDSYHIKVETEATEEVDLKTIVEEVKKESKNVDAVWLWIYEPGENGKLLAEARIPYNNKGQVMVGADNNEYIFEMD